MNKQWLLLRAGVLAILVLLTATVFGLSVPQSKTEAQLGTPETRDIRRMERLKEEIRHQLVMLPYYSVFDWLQAQVERDGTVTLAGQVTRPTLKSDAEARVEKIESATRVVNNIEVLPLSPMDDDIRIAVYRAIFRYDSPLFRYSTQSIPPIHIIVKNGRVALKGVVHNQMDSQLAEMAARNVSGVFEVRNELSIEQRLDQKVTKR
jgi:hyperosmotically inducible periplasmic protein